jgi:plastocyanin
VAWFLLQSRQTPFRRETTVTRDVKTFNVTQNPGEETPITVDAAGSFVVRCAIHPKMKLTVRVE